MLKVKQRDTNVFEVTFDFDDMQDIIKVSTFSGDLIIKIVVDLIRVGVDKLPYRKVRKE